MEKEPVRRVIAMVPAHNEEGCIEATIGALLWQTRVPDEIIVICDNCTDDTFHNAQRAAAAALTRNVTVVKTVANSHKKPGALNWAWNTFCQDADVLVTLDADTILPDNAVADWVREFELDPSLAGSSSKFTMRGSKFLVRLQRAEFARWTDTGLRRGWTSVLAGTGCSIRNSVVKEIASRPDRTGPWAYISQVEDFELTYRLREMGYHCHISPTVRAYTDAMDTYSSLWNQRMKWQVGTVEDLMTFGWNKLTKVDWWQQFAGLCAAFVRLGFVAMTAAALVFHMFHFMPIWLLPTIVFILNDTKQAFRIPHRDKLDVIMAAFLIPQEIFAWMRAGWFMAAWWEVLTSRVTGKKKDRWALQYKAEAERG